MPYLPRVRLVISTLCIALALACLSSAPVFPNQISRRPDTLQDKKATNQTTDDASSETADCLNPKLPLPRLFIRSGSLMNGKAILLPQPVYPKEAEAPGIYGTVRASVVIGEDGKVIWARIKSGRRILREAVAKVVCQARFSSSNMNVKVRGDILYRFVRRSPTPHPR